MDVQRRLKNYLPTTMKTSRSSRRNKSLLRELPRQLQRAYESSKLVQDHRGPAHQRRRKLFASRQATRTSRSDHSLRPILLYVPVSLPAPPPIPVGPAAPAILPIVDVDAAAGGVLPQQVPTHLQNLYERARENVGNMEMAREFWRARDRDHQEQRNQYLLHQVHPDHGAGVWAPQPVNA